MPTSNKMIEDLGASKRETNTDAPAIETDHARNLVTGLFHQTNVAASQTGVAIALGGDADAGTGWVAPFAGQVVGIAWALSAASTHVTGSLKATVAGTASGDAVSIDGGGTEGYTALTVATAPTFTAGQRLGVKVTTDSAWLPVTTDMNVWLLIRANA